MSKLEVDAIEPQSGTTITIGAAGDTVNLIGTLQSNGSPLPGDISEVVAGTGLSGGGTSGAVTINIDSAQPTITSLGTITSFRSTGIDDNADATAITINSSEQIGIGTSSPSTKLTIVEGGEPPASGMLLLQANSTQRQLRIQPPTDADNGFIDFRGGNLAFLDDGTEVARFQSGGKFGIGNSVPLTKLDIQASADNEDLIRLSHPSSPANAGALLGFNSDGTTDNNVITLGVHYSNDFYDVLNIQRSTRNVGIGTVNPQEQLDITSNVPRIRFTDLSVTNLRHVIGSEANDLEIRCDDGNVQATSHIGFKIDGSEKVRMTDTGRVGIGTSSPSTPLHVTKSALSGFVSRTSSTLTLESSGGTEIYLASPDSSYGQIRFGDTASTYSGGIQYEHNANHMLFQINSAERMRIDSSGDVQIGSTNSGVGGTIDLSIGNTSSSGGITLWSPTSSSHSIGFADGYTGTDRYRGYLEYLHSSDSMRFGTSATERMRLTSTGLGIGTSSPDTTLDVTSSATPTVIIQSSATTSQDAILKIKGCRTGAVTNNCQIIFETNDSESGSEHLGFITAGKASNSNASLLAFGTTTSDGGTSTEKMRIDNLGRVLIGTTSTSPYGSSTETGQVFGTAGSLQLSNDDTGSAANAALYINQVNTPVNNTRSVRFFWEGSQVGTITVTSSSTAFNTSSDYRLKENVIEMTNATDRLKQLQPKRFNFISDADTTVDGFLAHEVSSVVPEAISGTHNEVEVWKDGEELPEGVSVGDNKLDADGNTIPEYQGIDQSKLVPLLVKTIQELEARITALENA